MPTHVVGPICFEGVVVIDRAGEQQTQPLMHAASFDVVGATTAVPLDEAPGLVQAMNDAAKDVNPDILVLCHGGPIAEPEDAEYVLAHTRGVVGFYGASSMERLPTEVAITENTRRFTSLTIG